ncbi:rare lipoprotein A (peptidoglycan hydrolase) [Bradyrhizobium sp. GM0.4]
MLCLKTLGSVTRPRKAIAFVAATLLIGGTATEASAKSRHHHRYSHHHHRHHAQTDANTTSDWRNANASMTPSQGTGRSFSGMASFYGNESGSRTASGQRFNQRTP